MRGMDLTEYLPSAHAALDTVPDAHFAISWNNLGDADDGFMIGLDLVKSFMRAANPAELTDAQRKDITLVRRAEEILAGHVPLDGGTSLGNLRFNLYSLGGNLKDLVTDGEARQLIQRVVASEQVLTWLVSDRYSQKIRRTAPGYRGGPILEEHLRHIEETLDSDPEGRLALSLENFGYTEYTRREGVSLVRAYVRSADTTVMEGQLAADVRRLKRASAILENQITLGGMTFSNLAANVRDMMGDLSNFATTTEARDIVRRIVAAVPALRHEILAQPHVIAY